LAWNFAPSTGILSIDEVIVPEPAAYALIFGASLLGLVTLRRRRKKADGAKSESGKNQDHSIQT
jgi:hypothetical protein